MKPASHRGASVYCMFITPFAKKAFSISMPWRQALTVHAFCIACTDGTRQQQQPQSTAMTYKACPYQQQRGAGKAALQIVCGKVRIAGERCGEGGGGIQRHPPAAPDVAATLTSLMTCYILRTKVAAHAERACIPGQSNSRQTCVWPHLEDLLEMVQRAAWDHQCVADGV